MRAAERWAAVERLVDAALDLPAAERAAYVAAACGDDARLREDVERLLAACEAAESDSGFLRTPAAHFAADVVAEVARLGGDAPAELDVERFAAALADRYVIEGEIGRGGMAIVFRARDLRHDRTVALKVMWPERLAADAAAFLREIGITSRLTHPHILPVHDSGEAGGVLYYVTPFLEGESLRARLERETALPEPDALRILREVASALAYAHRHGVVHRDIKPENILLHDGHAVVADFGISRALATQSRGELHGAQGALDEDGGPSPGTPAYMAPEQAAGEAEQDHRVDLYSLGVVAYEMLSGAHPFGRPRAAAPFTPEHASASQPLELRHQGTDAHLSAVVQRLLAPRPDDRYATADDLLADLQGRPAAPAPADLRAPPRRLRHFGAAALVLVAVAAALFAGGKRGGEAGGVPARANVAVVAEPLPQRGTQPDDGVERTTVDWVTRGLLETHLVSVVPVGRLPATNDPDAVIASARTANARFLVLVGSVPSSADTVLLSARILDVQRSRLLRAVGPIAALRASPLPAVETLRQRVLGALATVVDPRLTEWSDVASQPTTFAAYEAFAAGLSAYFDRSRGEDANAHFLRAHALDTTFTTPLLWTFFRPSSRQKADSLKAFLKARRDRLPPWDQGVLDFFTRKTEEDGYRAFRRVVEAAPQSEWLYMLAYTALSTNRPAVAARALDALDPDRGWMRTWPAYWTAAAQAHHVLGEYEKELQVVRRGRARFPTVMLLMAEVRALAALQREAELRATLEQLSYEAAPVEAEGRPQFNYVISELRRHGYSGLGDQLADRLLRELDRSPGPDPEHENWIRTVLLWEAGRWEEAAPLIERLHAADPEDLLLLEMRAMLEASRGKRAEAESFVAPLATPRDSSSSARARAASRYWFAMAEIEALLGNKARAVQHLLTAGFDRLHPGNTHATPDLEPLYGYAPFERLAARHHDDPQVLPRGTATNR